ncbi:hypothetical protein CSIM01_09514 [Colletotrichum simmondsii]|uniref:Uncharacterized protein n=1 Tax=Colletotrichum simmondsii TaxID=703756 RepID=A0A135T956_9PEZI|nr:hypothetical protein CSIM01_09514 [Colletotrichum simmondsii]
MARPVKPTRCCRKVVDRVVRLDNPPGRELGEASLAVWLVPVDSGDGKTGQSGLIGVSGRYREEQMRSAGSLEIQRGPGLVSVDPDTKVRPGDTNQQWYDWSLSGAEGGPPRCGKDAAFRTTNCPGPAALEWSSF